ncbi:hypothetical protein BGX23_004359 [Mortierella sp. AD031]|nr:hypothetical protein BGX23_004359 [Mortierella sp. AD031]
MQLVYCSNLSLKAASALHQTSNAPTSNTQDTTLNNRTLDSVKIHEQDSIEQYHLRWLVKKLIEEFAKDKFNEPATLSEIIVLIPVLDYDNYRSLLTCFVTKFQHTPLLDVSLLQGLMQLVENAPLGYLEDDDLIKILDILRPRLEDTHQSSSEYLYQITLAICRLLDVMALQYVPDDESTLQAVLRFAGGVTMATLGVASICKLDPTNLFDSLEKLQQAAGASCEVAKSIIEGMEANQRGRFGTMQSLLKGVREGTKHEWYLILLAAKSFVQDGRFADFNRTVSEAPCCDKRPFQWGVCQILGEIAMNPLWDPLTRQQAVDFLGTLHRNAGGWKQYPDVKQWIVTILKQLNKSSEDTLMDHARLTLQDLEVDDASTSSPAAAEATPYQLMSRLPLPEYSPLLDRVRKIPYVEPDLLRLKDNILQERCSDIYIPPQAKASLQSQDDDLFPLEKKIHEFLASDRAKVLLLLGDSGAGKSTFSQHLEHHLWSNYQQGGIVPLRILLSAINQPDQDMIKKHLKSNDFTTEQIMELKLARVFVLICDGYDESRQLCNLYHTNRLNRRGQWRCKVIITCRSQYLGHDYRMLFQPTSTTNYLDAPPGSFEEAVIAPFSTDQIKDYVKQYVDLQPRQWSASEYMDKLANIRDLMDLVKNPFLLTLSLQALPAIVGHKTDLSSIRVTRVILYDRFMESWLQYNKQRLQDHRHKFSEAEQKEFQIMLDGNFTQEGTVFLKKLSVCVFDKQPGNPVIIYPAITPRWENGVGAATDDTWKEEFFGSSARIKLLREASPLTRSGKQFRLLHRSLLEYFYSLHFYDPCDFVDMPQDDPPTFESMLLSIFTHSLSQRNIIEEPMVVQFLADRARVDPFFEQQLKIMIGRLTTEPGSSQAKKNAVTIFVEAGIRYRGLDLKEMSVQQRLELFGV